MSSVISKKILLLVLLSIFSLSAHAGEKIRVGFFQFDGYHMENRAADNPKNIRRSGYGYDLLQLLQPYTNWEYEYVGYEKGWPAMLSMLENGEIDMLTSAVKIPEKELKFDFSSQPVGFSSVIMSVKAGCEKYHQNDYANWNGMKVGVLANNSKNEVFRDFAKQKRFDYQEITFNSQDALTAALQDGSIDAIITGSLRKLHNEWVFEKLDLRPFFIIVKKGNQQLLNQINSAIDMLAHDDPSFFLRLHKKYYNNNDSTNGHVQYTKEERNFIEECQHTKRTFSVLVNPDSYPYSFFENGELQGLMRNVLDILESRSGLKLIPVNVKNRREYFDKIEKHQCDIVLDMLGDRSFAENVGYIITPQYMDAMVVKLSRKDSAEHESVAVTMKFDTRSMRMLDHDPKIKDIKVYDALADTIRAVQSGRQDFAYLFSESAQCAVLDDPNGMLVLDPKGFIAPQALAVNKDCNRLLLTILSKTVLSISPGDMAQSTLMESIRRARTPTFRDWMNRHPFAVFLTLSGLFLFVTGCLFMVLLALRKAKKAYAELRKNSRMWKLLIDSLPIHICAKDVAHDSRYVFNNKARCEFYQFKDGKTEGFTDFDFLPNDFAEERRKKDMEIIRTPGLKSSELLQMKNAKGQIRVLHHDQIPFQDTDGTLLLLGCSVDATDFENEKKRAEENAEWFKKR